MPTPDPGIIRAVNDNRAALRAGASDAFKDLTSAYRLVHTDLQADFNKFKRVWERKYLEAVQAGQKLGDGWLVRSTEFDDMIRRYETNIARTAPLVGRTAASTANSATALGAAHAAELLSVAGVAATQPITAITATTASGPLADLIAARAPEHAATVANILRTAVGRGYAPARTARLLTQATDGALFNAATIVRTEQMRAYRAAALETYDQNPTVQQWRWDARCGDRTCAACWAMHGELFDTDEPMESHPNCMCVMIPVVEGVEYRADGETLFAAESDEVQLGILGPAAHAAYKDGAIELKDLVRETRSPEWGLTRSTGSLRDAVGPDKAREYAAKARAGTV